MESDDNNPVYQLHLTPHRSLSQRGFVFLMGGIALFSFLAGLYFWRLGAWPITGFFGLDFLLIYAAFRWTYHTGRTREIIRIQNGELVIRRISPTGKIEKTALQAFWLRAHMSNERLLLTSHGRTIQIGSFLALEEKQAVCQALTQRLREYRNND